MKLFDFFKRKRKTLIITDDGQQLRCIIAVPNRIISSGAPKENDLDSAIAFGKKRKCKSVMLIKTGDVRELDVKPGHDLDEEERKNTIEYAAANNTGDRSGSQKISYLDGMKHDLKSGILISYFDTEKLLETAQKINSAKMEFKGVVNYKQLLMAHHFAEPAKHNDVFLFLIGNHGFAAIPSMNKLQIKNLPFGVPSGENDEEYFAKAERRLSMLPAGKKITLYSPDASKELCSKLQSISNAASVSMTDFNQELEKSILLTLDNKKTSLHPALPPIDPQESKKSGTFIGLLLIAATVASLLYIQHRNDAEINSLKEKIRTNEEKTFMLNSEKNTLEKLENVLKYEQELYQVMIVKEKVSKDFIIFMNLLARTPVQLKKYNRITSIEELANGIYFSGESIWQPDLSNFFTLIERELSKYSLTLISDGLSKEENGRIIFRAHVSAGTGGK